MDDQQVVVAVDQRNGRNSAEIDIGFIDGDDTPWSKAFLTSAYASRGIKMRVTSGGGAEALMGSAEGCSMFYLEARCVALARAIMTRHPDKFGYYIGRAGFDYKGIVQVNHDPMIGRVPGADGIKTGFTNESGFSYLGTARRDGQRLALVLAGVENGRLRARLAKAYVEWGFSAFERRPLFAANAVVGEARVQDGDARGVALKAAGPVAINLPRGSSIKLTATIRYDGPLRAPIAAGQEVAMLEVTAPGIAPARIPLYAEEAVGTAGPIDRIINAIAGVFA